MNTRIGRVVAIAIAGIIFVVAWALIDIPPLAVLREWAESTGAWFPVLFWLLYVVITQFPIPRTVLTLSSGILFGTGWGLFIAITATTVSAALSLSVVRGLLRDWVSARLNHPRVEQINAHLEQRGWIAVISLRMIAAIPFSILNYVAALTRVRVVPFTIATFIGSLPGTTIAVLFGDTITGEANPIVVIATVALAAVGITLLVFEARAAHRQAPRVD